MTTKMIILDACISQHTLNKNMKETNIFSSDIGCLSLLKTIVPKLLRPYSFRLQEVSKEQNTASLGMYLTADKYDMPCLLKFARRSLMQSMRLTCTKGWKGNTSEALDPWVVAAHALQFNDNALVEFCMDLVVAPLRQGKEILAPSVPPTWPALSVLLVEKINNISRSQGNFYSNAPPR